MQQVRSSHHILPSDFPCCKLVIDAVGEEISITAPPERESQDKQENEDADQAFDLPSNAKSGASQNEKQEITRIPREEEVGGSESSLYLVDSRALLVGPLCWMPETFVAELE